LPWRGSAAGAIRRRAPPLAARADVLGDAPAQNQVGGFLADHCGRRLGVAADEERHDRGVGDAQALDPPHPELRVDDRALVGAHPACPDGVIDRIGALADQFAKPRRIVASGPYMHRPP
jgi:hypothetical protein